MKLIITIPNPLRFPAIEESLSDDVVALVHLPIKEPLQALRARIEGLAAEQEIEGIAIATIGAPGFFIMGENAVVSSRSINSRAHVQEFFQFLGLILPEEGRVDVVACEVGAGEKGQKLQRLLAFLTQRKTIISDSKIGRDDTFENWETSDGFDLQQAYLANLQPEFSGHFGNPRVDNPIPDQTAYIGEPFSVSATAATRSDDRTKTFSDPDLPPTGSDFLTLLIDAGDVPSWATRTYPPNAATIAGTPDILTDNEVAVVCYDSLFNIVIDSFQLTVEDAPTPPPAEEGLVEAVVGLATTEIIEDI